MIEVAGRCSQQQGNLCPGGYPSRTFYHSLYHSDASRLLQVTRILHCCLLPNQVLKFDYNFIYGLTTVVSVFLFPTYPSLTFNT
ncbi:hypothetical protein BpHYR1_006397 [Brachionus plicatilis]|uniref:Uncharacterized protein n=1 Tax=Brachionus plicatilis TaxID=10195 RepID=A0A3M7QZI7_BRAPC|nr:hypothetical protein BpHYR1_006397 [Brachionus plicatilis]